MCSVLGLLPGLVGTALVLVPGMTILMVAVVVSIVGAVLMLILGLEAHGRNQSRTQQKRTYTPMKSLHVFLLERNSMVWTRSFPLYAANPGKAVQFRTLQESRSAVDAWPSHVFSG